MNEQLVIKKESLEPEYDREELLDIAKELGLQIKLPEESTVAFQRIISACKEHANLTEQRLKRANSLPPSANSFLMELEMKNMSPYYRQKAERRNMQHRELTEKYDTQTREAHNRLCVMLLGSTYGETDPDLREKIALFALNVAGKEDLSEETKRLYTE